MPRAAIAFLLFLAGCGDAPDPAFARHRGEVVDARYEIDLGRWSTGRTTPRGLGLGYGFYGPEAPPIALGDRYALRCRQPALATPAFFCAVLLRTVPRAAIAFRLRPRSPAEARARVDEAEAFLAAARRAGEERR